MSHDLRPTSVASSREEGYAALMPQLLSLLEGERDLVACLANFSAALHTAFGFLWVGFYLVRGEELVLGPFQGPVACSRIAKGAGVCGQAWAQGKTLIVGDVSTFSGHIACNERSRSEIVVPYPQPPPAQLVLDIDSDQLNDFNEVDAQYLSHMLKSVLSHGIVL